MICFECKKEIKDERRDIMIDEDGDFVCDEICKKEYERRKEDFFNRIIKDENLFTRWIHGDDV